MRKAVHINQSVCFSSMKQLLKQIKVGTGEVTQSVLPSKLEDLSLILRTDVKMLCWGHELIILVLEMQKLQGPWGFCPASLDYQMRSMLVRDWVSKEVDSIPEHVT